MNTERLLERFLEFVQIDTTARPEADSYPSSPGQLILGKRICEHLAAAGIEVRQDEHGIVWADLPANVDRDVPRVAFCAHLDTSPELPGAEVRPQVIRNYAGGDIPLPGSPERVIRFDETPALRQALGCTIITSDGTTLLGADDKSGVAAIVEAFTYLAEHPEIPHGPLRACFTCDEEIGHGVDHITAYKMDAVCCYTLDGVGTDTIDVETFSADEAKIVIEGVNVHPAIGKGKLVSALKAMASLVNRFPRNQLAPEATEGREGFLHPHRMEGTVERAELRILLRDFETGQLVRQAAMLERMISEVREEFPGIKVDFEVRKQYRNLRDGLKNEPRVVAFAEEALRALGRTPRRAIVRGGTDGSLLTEKGVPTPNLSSGQYTPHAFTEWACLEHIELAARWVVAIAQRWCDSEAAR
ncbi:MAG: peptidase T [Planctomycetota bacterium]|nr:MAG: peptidase T [Planctomycetota bacterium]